MATSSRGTLLIKSLHEVFNTMCNLKYPTALPWAVCGSASLWIFKNFSESGSGVPCSWLPTDVDIWVVSDDDYDFKAFVHHVGRALGYTISKSSQYIIELAPSSGEGIILSFIQVVKRPGRSGSLLSLPASFDISVCCIALMPRASLPMISKDVVCIEWPESRMSFIADKRVLDDVKYNEARLFPEMEGEITARTIDRMHKYSRRGFGFRLGANRTDDSPFSYDIPTILTEEHSPLS